MATRTQLGLIWTMLSTSLIWLRARAIGEARLSPLSNDWLHDIQRKTIRGQF